MKQLESITLMQLQQVAQLVEATLPQWQWSGDQPAQG